MGSSKASSCSLHPRRKCRAGCRNNERKVFLNCLAANSCDQLISGEKRQSGVPGHAAVDCKVEGVGEADDDVYEEDDVVHQLVVQEILFETEINFISHDFYVLLLFHNFYD